MLKDILTIDRTQVRFRRALAGVVVLVTAFAFIDVMGIVAAIAGVAALFVTAACGDGGFRERLPGMIWFTIIGAAIGGLAFWSIESTATVALVLGSATLLGTLAAAYGSLAARRGLFLTVWAMLALVLGWLAAPPVGAAIAFLVGGGIAIAVTAIRLAVAGEDPASDTDKGVASAGEGVRRPGLIAVFRGPIGVFAIIRTAAVVLTVFLGFWLLPHYPLWAPFTVIVIARPGATNSVAFATERTIGTAIGAFAAIIAAQMMGNHQVGVMLALLFSAYLMLLFMNANFTLFVTFLTMLIILIQDLFEADAFDAGWERLLAAGMGAAIALAAVLIDERMARSASGAT